MTKFGLSVDGKLLGFNVRGFGESDSPFGETEYTLDESIWTENVWLVDNEGTAKFAAENDTKFFGSSYTTPGNPYVGRCKVVKVTLTVEEV